MGCEMSVVALVVDVAATRRLTRLVTKDEITAPVREWAWKNDRKKLTYLVNCPYCVSVWAGVLVASRVLPAPLRWGLALSELANLPVPGEGI